MIIPDDQCIKAEIEDISRRIDHIIKTVNQSIAEQDSSEDPNVISDAGREDVILQKPETTTQETG
jgi:hypothetical protein